VQVFLRLLKQISLTISLLLPVFIEAQNKAKDTTIQCSISGNLVLPIYYGIVINQQVYNDANNISYASSVIRPNYKVSGNIGIQVKNKHNFLVEFQFQPYVFDCKGPLITKTSTYGPYGATQVSTESGYETFRYTQNRHSIGVGFTKSKKRSCYTVTAGASFFLGTANLTYSYYYNLKYYDKNGNLSYSLGDDKIFYVAKIGTYLKASYGYQVLKKLSATAGIDYCMIYYNEGTYYTNNPHYGVYPYKFIHLVSFNVGLKYNLTKKVKS